SSFFVIRLKLWSLLYFNLSHHPIVLMFKYVTVEHIYAFIFKLNGNFYSLIRGNGKTIFPASFVLRWCFSIPGKDLKLSTMDVERVNHAAHHVWFIIDVPYFGDTLFLRKINSFRVKFFTIYRYHIHHAEKFNFFCYW